MGKRKISGILKYGPRKAKDVQRYQAGGRLAIGTGYDYREDPYEMALLRQENNLEVARTRANALRDAATIRAKAASGRKGKEPTLKGFDPITKGLPSFNKFYNNALQQEVIKYNEFIQTNPIDSLESQQLFNAIKNKGVELNALGEEEKKSFETALGRLDDTDLNTKAITSNGAVAIEDKSGKKSIVTMSEYLEKKLDSRILSLSEFMDWKKNSAYNIGDELVQEFTTRGAVGLNKVNKNYIEPKKAAIMAYSKDDGMLQVDNMVISPDDFLRVLNTSSSGSAITTQAQKSNKKAVDTIINNLYPEIRMNSAASPLMASLRAEVLADQANIEELKKETTLESRNKKLNEKAVYLLGLKLFQPLGGSSSKENDGEDTGEDEKLYASGTDPVLNSVMASTINMADGTIIKSTPILSSDKGHVNIGTIEGAVPASMINVTEFVDPNKKEEHKKHFITHNEAINKVAIPEKTYFFNGSVTSVLAASGNATGISAGDFLSKSAILPSQSSDMMLMPFNHKDKKLAVDKVTRFNVLKRDPRKAFLASIKKHGFLDADGNKVSHSITEADITDNSFNKLGNPKARLMESEYRLWLKRATSQTSQDKESTDREKAMLKDATAALTAVSEKMAKINGDDKIVMTPMLKNKVIVSSEKFPGLYNKLIKTKEYAGNGSPNGLNLRKATDKEVEYMEALGDDTDNFISRGWAAAKNMVGLDQEPEYFVVDVLTMAKDLKTMAIENGTTANKLASLNKFQASFNRYLSSKTPEFDKIALDNIYKVLIQE